MIRNKYTFNYFAIILIAIILGSCASKKNNKAEQVHLKVLNYGRSSTKLLWTEKNSAMPSGEKGTTDYKLNIMEVTDTIKIHKGAQFGVEYILESPSNNPVTLTTIWTYPTIVKNNEGAIFEKAEYKIEKYPNQYTYSNYTLDEPYEMLPGNWNIKILSGESVLLDKNFYLVE